MIKYDQNRLKDRIRTLLAKRKAILLAHNYQRDEIQEIADYTGDSLALSQTAAQTPAEVIVFCGVHFMAESASILSPQKTVILPRMDAGCPMADMITVGALKLKKKEFPQAIVVCYVNSSAEVKAESDICCTSANAVRVIKSLDESRTVLMVPDQNLAKYAGSKLTREIIPWPGFCPTHHRLRAADIQRSKRDHPQALVAAHPECRPEVLALADHICSTSGMYSFARQSEGKEFIIGTEAGVLFKLRRENPEKSFYLPSHRLICPNMKLTALEDIIDVLENMSNVISVPEETRIRAKKALDRMLEIPRDN